jgi:trimethylamine--corrinoid protein Co-methyltransferase
MLPALAGANLIYGMGMLEMGQVLSFSQMVMDDEFVAMIKRSIYGIEVNDELMAVDLIKKVGIGGNFLGQQHTLDHIEGEQVQADLIDRRMRVF